MIGKRICLICGEEITRFGSTQICHCRKPPQPHTRLDLLGIGLVCFGLSVALGLVLMRVLECN